MAKLLKVIFFLALAITLVKYCSASTAEHEKIVEKATMPPKQLHHLKLTALSMSRNLIGTCTTSTCEIGLLCPDPCQCITESGICYSNDCTQYDCGVSNICPSPCQCLEGYGLCYIPEPEPEPETEPEDCTKSGCGYGVECLGTCQCITEYGICVK